MLNIKRLFVVSLLFSVFLSTDVVAQKINQFDANGKRTGIWKKHYPNGKIRYEGQFKNGKEVGVFKFYENTASNQPHIVKEFTGSDIATVKFYTPKGKLKVSGKMQGKNRVGKWTYFFSNGKIFSEESYTDGKLDGVLKNYYPNGKVTLEIEYKNGKKNGFSKTYTDDGVLIEEVNYTQGKLQGLAKYYDLKGGLKEQGHYENGIRKGKWEYYIDGELAKKPKSSYKK